MKNQPSQFFMLPCINEVRPSNRSNVTVLGMSQCRLCDPKRRRGDGGMYALTGDE